MGALTQQETGEAALSVEEEAEDINFDAALHLHQQELKGRLANANAWWRSVVRFSKYGVRRRAKMTMVQRAAVFEHAVEISLGQANARVP
ncbi:hypothetical protein NW754_009714 [Fusarium falciforme]|nr:hypothetical protein NW754_009714 [Fusarium falciforme]